MRPCSSIASLITVSSATVMETFERLRKVEHLIPFAQDEEIVINGRRCRNVYFHWEDLRKAVMQRIVVLPGISGQREPYNCMI